MTPAPSLVHERPQRSLWRNISFMLMWSSVAASGFGDRLIQLAAEPMLGVYAPGASAAKIQAGIMFFFFVPYLALTLVGGWLADRVPRKWIMLACDEGRALVLLIAFFMAAGLSIANPIPPSHHWKIYLIMAATGFLERIFNPPMQSKIKNIVATGHLQQANAVLAGIALIASLIGLQVGGPIDEKVSGGIRLGIMMGVLSYGISGWFFAFLKTTKQSTVISVKHPNVVVQMSQAMGYIVRHHAVRNLVVMNIVFWTAAWFVNAGIAALNKGRYGLPAENYLSNKATMMACLGAGLLCGSFVVMWIRTRRESGIVAMASLMLAGASMFALAFNRSYYTALVIAVVAGLFGGIFLICVDTLTQSITPNHIRGRVFGLRSLMNTISAVGINFIIWRLPEARADNLVIPCMAVTAGILTLVGLLGAWVQLTTGPMPTRRLNFLWRIDRLFVLVWHRVTWVDRHHVPSTGAVILAPNHTAAVDPLLIQAAVPRLICWLMLTEHRHQVLSFLWKAIEPISLDRDSSDLAKIRQVVGRLKEGHLVGLFPEGRLQRDVRDLKLFEGGIAMAAKRSDCTIVPVWIVGTPETRHMVWHFLKPSCSQVIFGQPYKPDPTASRADILDDLQRRMEELSRRASP